MTRKKAEKELRQRFILNAARKLFAEKGLENLTKEEVAQKAEYTRRTLYLYFKNLDEIGGKLIQKKKKSRKDS